MEEVSQQTTTVTPPTLEPAAAGLASRDNKQRLIELVRYHQQYSELENEITARTGLAIMQLADLLACAAVDITNAIKELNASLVTITADVNYDSAE